MAALTLFLALLLGASALHKALDRERLAHAAARLGGTSTSAGPLLLLIAGTIEVAAALCLLLPEVRATGALIAAALWTGYAAALLRRRGEALDCGCDLVARVKPVMDMQIARPALLALLAVAVAALPAAPFEIMTPFAALGLLALYVAAAELLAIPRPAWRKP